MASPLALSLYLSGQPSILTTRGSSHYKPLLDLCESASLQYSSHLSAGSSPLSVTLSDPARTSAYLYPLCPKTPSQCFLLILLSNPHPHLA